MPEHYELSARPDALWMSVRLTADQVRVDTLRVLAELHAADPDHLSAVLDSLTAGLVSDEAFAVAVLDLEANTEMEPAAVELSGAQAVQLADELADAASRSFAHRLRAAEDRPLRVLPHQVERGRAA